MQCRNSQRADAVTWVSRPRGHVLYGGVGGWVGVANVAVSVKDLPVLCIRPPIHLLVIHYLFKLNHEPHVSSSNSNTEF